ncbi:hypothetical protein DESC_350003 [Desulfosarcina cetonica]|nr:hypothetical protein DESC_350003 [Desulfosarcina cetonica]
MDYTVRVNKDEADGKDNPRGG